MESLSKLALKGYFEQLKSDINSSAGIRKEDQKSLGYETLRDESTFDLLELLIKAVALVEEIHQTDDSFLHEDHVADYQSMINSLNAHGIAYKGNSEILEYSNTAPLPLAKKKPMQKASSTNKAAKNRNRKAS